LEYLAAEVLIAPTTSVSHYVNLKK